MVTLVAFALLFAIGFTAQQTGLCMVSAAKEVVYHRRANRFAGYTLSALVAMLAMIIAQSDHRIFISGYGVSWVAILGGVLFAVGARINGRCATGTIVALTSGRVYHLATIAGMILVAILAYVYLQELLALREARPVAPSPLAVYSHTAIVPSAVLLCGMLGWFLYRNRPQVLPYHQWNPALAMLILGVASGVLYALDMRWTYTALIADATYSEVSDWRGQMLAVAVLVGGLFAGALWKNHKHRDPEGIRYGSARQWLQSLVGGGLMGAGATLVPGGNDTMLYTGIPLLLPNLLIGYGAMLVTLHASLWLFPNPTERDAPYQG